MLKRWQLLYSPDTGVTGGGEQPSASGNVNGHGQAPEQPAATSTPPEKMIPQSQVDQLMGERAQRASESAVAKLLESLGLKDVDSLKAVVQQQQKAQADQMTELQKAQAEVDRLTKLNEQATAQSQTVLTQAQEMLMRAATLTEAGKSDYNLDPAAIKDIWGFIKLNPKWMERIKPVEENPGEYTGLDAVLKELIAAKPYLVAEKTPPTGTPRRAGFRRPAETLSPAEVSGAAVQTRNKF